MVCNKKLELSLTMEETRRRLAMQIRHVHPTGYVNESGFRIYKTALHSGNRTRFQYVFTGTVGTHANHTIIHYKLRPTAPTFLMLCILFCPIIDAVVHRINGANNGAFLLVSIAINIAAILIVIWQEQQCIERFVRHFRDPKTGDGLREP